jgi:hypothetical protein
MAVAILSAVLFNSNYESKFKLELYQPTSDEIRSINGSIKSARGSALYCWRQQHGQIYRTAQPTSRVCTYTCITSKRH